MAKPVFEVYKDVSDEWRWRLKASNGEIIGTSSSSYKNKSDCLRRIDALRFFSISAPPSLAKEKREKSKGYTKQIFFSHSSSDDKLIDLIRLVFEFSDIKPYFAKLEKAGQNPSDKICNEIGKSNALFSILTSSVYGNQDTLFWVLYEIGIAKGKEIPIYVWIEKGIEVPEFVRYITDFTTFEPKEDMDCNRAVREMMTIALEFPR